MDGRLDRQASSAAEQAIEALGRHDPASARMAVAIAVERDQAGVFASLADAVYLAASRLEEGDDVDDATWNQLADAVGPGPLQGLVEQARG
jgi:hypothetical protein